MTGVCTMAAMREHRAPIKWNKRFIEIANMYSKELENYIKVPKEEINKVSITQSAYLE